MVTLNINNYVWIASHVFALKRVQMSNNTVVTTIAIAAKAFNESKILIRRIECQQKKLKINYT